MTSLHKRVRSLKGNDDNCNWFELILPRLWLASLFQLNFSPIHWLASGAACWPSPSPAAPRALWHMYLLVPTKREKNSQFQSLSIVYSSETTIGGFGSSPIAKSSVGFSSSAFFFSVKSNTFSFIFIKLLFFPAKYSWVDLETINLKLGAWWENVRYHHILRPEFLLSSFLYPSSRRKNLLGTGTKKRIILIVTFF